MHYAVIAATQQQRVVGHIARDSTAIPVRERFPETAKQKAQKRRAKRAAKRDSKSARRKGSKREFGKAKAAERGTRIARQRHQTLDRIVKELSRYCDISTKTSSQGHRQCWREYKLHLDVAEFLPISALPTSAGLHDSQSALPLMTMTSERVTYLYELIDSAYDAESIHAHSRKLNHVPIIAPHSRRGTKKPSPLQKVFTDKPTPQRTRAHEERYKARSMSARVNARLKDEFGASQMRVRGAVKVMAHLMFGAVALTVDQWLQLRPPELTVSPSLKTNQRWTGQRMRA
jgi:hypothetical protein